MSRQNEFVKRVQEIATVTIEKMGLLINEWHLGRVANVNFDGTLDVYIDGSKIETTNVSANPDIVFAIGDAVWVHYVNRSSRDLYIPYKRFSQ